MNVLMLLRSELRRSAAVLAGIAAVLALSLSISIATGMTDRMLRHASAQAASATKSYPCTAGRPAQDTRTTTDASRSWAGCPKAARPGTAPS